MNTLLIFGGSGFIGGELCSYFKEKNIRCVVIDIIPPKDVSIPFIKMGDSDSYKKYVNGIYSIINLSGYPISQFRYTDEVKNKIYQSRINTTRHVVDFIASIENKPLKFLSTSAIGYYGTNSQVCDENSKPGDDFLARVCVDWETEAKRAKQFVSTCCIRNGIVLGDGGLLKTVTRYSDKHVLIGLKNDNAYISWVSIHDLMKLYDNVLQTKDIPDVINAVSGYVMYNELYTLLKNIYNPKLFIKIPFFVARQIFGKELSNVLFSSQKVISSVSSNFKCNDKLEFLKNILP